MSEDGHWDDRRFRVARINCWSRTRRDHIVSFFMALYFWINVPVGILTMIAGEKILPKDITMSRNSIDKSGFGLFSVAILTFSVEFSSVRARLLDMVAISIDFRCNHCFYCFYSSRKTGGDAADYFQHFPK